MACNSVHQSNTLSCEGGNNQRDQERIYEDPQGVRAVGKETIAFPSRAAATQQAREVIHEAPEIRKELVARLRDAFHVGTLMLDRHVLPEKLIGMQLNDLRSAA